MIFLVGIPLEIVGSPSDYLAGLKLSEGVTKSKIEELYTVTH